MLPLALAALALGAATVPACRRAGERPTRGAGDRPPNILLITLDTLRADHVSSYARSPVATPNLDGLARRGARFTRAFAQVPLTTPSHASILTGTLPSEHGIRDNGGFALAPGVPTLASLAREAGYETAAFIAAAVLDRQFGLDRGFDHYADGRGSSAAPGAPGSVGELPGRVVTDRALAWLAASRSQARGAAGGQRFLMWVHYFDAHAPYDPPPPFGEAYPGDAYSGEVASVDQEVGRLLRALEEHGLTQSTLVVAVSDHGESLGDHGEFTHGVFLYDVTTRIVLLIAGPGVPAGRVVEDLARSIDILPTLAGLCGFAAGERSLGMSLVPALAGGRVRTVFSFAETSYPKTNLGWSDLRSVRTDEWKLILAPRPELYRISDDPAESLNIHASFPAEAERLGKLAAAVAGGTPPEAAVALAPGSREELQALGYVGAGARRESTGGRDLPDPKDGVRTLEALERAEQSIRQQEYQAAAALLERTIDEDPGNPALHARLVHSYERLGAFQKAIRALQPAGRGPRAFREGPPLRPGVRRAPPLPRVAGRAYQLTPGTQLEFVHEDGTIRLIVRRRVADRAPRPATSKPRRGRKVARRLKDFDPAALLGPCARRACSRSTRVADARPSASCFVTRRRIHDAQPGRRMP